MKEFESISLPVDSEGNIIWHQNEVTDKTQFAEFGQFNSVMRFKRTDGHGRFIFVKEGSDVEYYSFMNEFVEMIPHLHDGKIAGRFFYVRRSSGCGIKLIHPTFN